MVRFVPMITHTPVNMHPPAVFLFFSIPLTPSVLERERERSGEREREVLCIVFGSVYIAMHTCKHRRANTAVCL